jgi:Macrocin-O-methyltransferase (TylF)
MVVTLKRARRIVSMGPLELMRRSIDRLYFDKSMDCFNIDKLSRLAAGVSSSNYVSCNLYNAERLKTNLELIDFACKQVKIDGLRLEFGVASGSTINRISGNHKGIVHGFDGFEGLPETWRPGFEKGAFAVAELPKVNNNVNLVVGWFDKTLPGFLAENKGNVALLHVDCDLYSSTKTIFRELKDRIVSGTIIIFDEYFNYPSWEVGEFKAFAEFVAEKNVSYRYIAYVPSHQQVAVVIERI